MSSSFTSSQSNVFYTTSDVDALNELRRSVEHGRRTARGSSEQASLLSRRLSVAAHTLISRYQAVTRDANQQQLQQLPSPQMTALLRAAEHLFRQLGDPENALAFLAGWFNGRCVFSQLTGKLSRVWSLHSSSDWRKEDRTAAEADERECLVYLSTANSSDFSAVQDCYESPAREPSSSSSLLTKPQQFPAPPPVVDLLQRLKDSAVARGSTDDNAFTSEEGKDGRQKSQSIQPEPASGLDAIRFPLPSPATGGGPGADRASSVPSRTDSFGGPPPEQARAKEILKFYRRKANEHGWKIPADSLSSIALTSGVISTQSSNDNAPPLVPVLINPCDSVKQHVLRTINTQDLAGLASSSASVSSPHDKVNGSSSSNPPTSKQHTRTPSAVSAASPLVVNDASASACLESLEAVPVDDSIQRDRNNVSQDDDTEMSPLPARQQSNNDEQEHPPAPQSNNWISRADRLRKKDEGRFWHYSELRYNNWWSPEAPVVVYELCPPFADAPHAIESFVLDMSVRRAWFHPNLVPVLGGYTDSLLTLSNSSPAGQRSEAATAQQGIPKNSSTDTEDEESHGYIVLGAVYPDVCVSGPPVESSPLNADSSVHDNRTQLTRLKGYTSLHDALFEPSSSGTHFSLEFCIQTLLQLGDALQYMMLDAQEVPPIVHAAWATASPSRIYYRTPPSLEHSQEAAMLEREMSLASAGVQGSTFYGKDGWPLHPSLNSVYGEASLSVLYAPPFAAETVPNRWQVPHRATADPPAYALTALLIAMLIREPPYAHCLSTAQLRHELTAATVPAYSAVQIEAAVKASELTIESDIRRFREVLIRGTALDTSDLPPPSPYYHRLYQYYAAHNPSRLGDIEAILRKYQGQEEMMFASLVAKYGPEPKSTTTATAATAFSPQSLSTDSKVGFGNATNVAASLSSSRHIDPMAVLPEEAPAPAAKPLKLRSPPPQQPPVKKPLKLKDLRAALIKLKGKLDENVQGYTAGEDENGTSGTPGTQLQSVNVNTAGAQQKNKNGSKNNGGPISSSETPSIIIDEYEIIHIPSKD